jgi:hypothetical protein
MKSQFALFGGAGETPASLPEGFGYRAEMIGPDEERALAAHLGRLPFREFEFHGHTGRRRVVSFGWHYDFSARHLREADDFPEYLLPLRAAAAAFAGLAPEEFPHALVTEYGPRACSASGARPA